MHHLKFISAISIVFSFEVIISTEEKPPIMKVKGRYTRDTEKYSVVIPKKINKEGNFVSHYLPHFYEAEDCNHRRKRETEHESVNYMVPLDGEDHHVELWPNINFLAPGLVVEEHYNRGDIGNLSNIKFRKIRSSQCHFKGAVKGIPESSAALSTCYGLAGYIRTPKEHYIIEPAERNETEEDIQHLHLVYKRSDLEENYPETNCGTKGRFHDAWEERMQWEKINGKNIENWVKGSFYKSFRPFSNRVKKRECPPYSMVSPDICNVAAEPTCPSLNELYFELMITIDFKVITECHKQDDIETFIFTVFNMVSTNFQDASIGVPIHLKLVRLIELRFDYPELDVLRYPPQKLLVNYCMWQMEFNPHKEEHPNHHDYALLVTKFEACQGHVMGATNMASVCRPDKACGIVSDEGLLLANIITHQIGHSLGAEHDDGEGGGCIAEEPDGTKYHMGPLISMSSTDWSICSQQCIAQFITTHSGWCLADVPSDHDYHFPDILPGQIYSAAEQCSLNYRMTTMPCKVGQFCKTLYCQISSDQCATTGDPPAAGTSCASNMWCFRGQCVHRGQRPGATNGEWATWGDWSPCTRSCGGGVQSCHRSCTNPPPAHGGRYCIGSWLRHRMCAVNPCEGYCPSFADVQCKMTDNRVYRGRHYTWNQFSSFFQNIACTLVCVNERGLVAIRSPVVLDGTPCNPLERDVCIEGSCTHIGCDWGINSKGKDDMCGVCHGNGTECRVIQGCFDEPDVQGLVPFLKLPVGTSLIYIREINPSTCFLSISSTINSSFYLNSLRGGDQLPGQINIAGSVGAYEMKADMERIYIRGAIQVPISVNLMCKDEVNKGIRYQYAVPERNLRYIPCYRWQYLVWDVCSDPCGGGSQRAKASCVEERGGEVEDRFCQETLRPPDETRSCNNYPCVAKWWIGPWSDCDCSDGQGIMVRIVMCMRSRDEDSTRAEVVDEKECSDQPKPKLEKPCNFSKEIEILEAKLNLRDLRSAPMGLVPYSEEDDFSDDDFLREDPHSSIEGDSYPREPFLTDENRVALEESPAEEAVAAAVAPDKSAVGQIGSGVPNIIPPAKEGLAVNQGNATGLEPALKVRGKHSFNLPSHYKKIAPLGRYNESKLTTDNKVGGKSTGTINVVKSNRNVQIGKERSAVSSPRNLLLVKVNGPKRPANRVEGVSKALARKVQTTKTDWSGERPVQQSKAVSHKQSLFKKEMADRGKEEAKGGEGKGAARTRVHPPTVAAPMAAAAAGGNGKSTKAVTPPPRNSSTAPPYRQDKKVSTTPRPFVSEESTPWNAQDYVERLFTTINGSSAIPPLDKEDLAPPDLPSRVETANVSIFHLRLAPIETTRSCLPQTDAEYQIFGMVGRMPVGNALSLLPIVGSDVVKTLDEAKKHATPPPYINIEELQ